jgi:cytoskeletal protein CcmA (bactofilin family)
MNSAGTVIGKGICIRGEISGAEDFFLDGMVEGNITLMDKRLTIGPNGLVQADIVAGDLVVFGRVEGSATASARAELKHSAVFTGDLTASRLSIEDNASLQGHVELVQAKPAAAPKKSPTAELTITEEELESIEPEYSEAV